MVLLLRSGSRTEGQRPQALDSNVVLLLLEKGYTDTGLVSFRFQCGSIITIPGTKLKPLSSSFRFQCGSIITSSAGKVRIEISSFRFQCGSIITRINF